MYSMMMNQPPKEGEPAPVDPFTEAEVSKNYTGEGLTVSNFKTYKDEEAEPNRHVEIDVAFTKLTDLSKCNEFSKWSYKFEAVQGSHEFSAYLPVEKPAEELTEEEKKNQEQANQMLEAYTYTTIVIFPGKVLETNGEIDKENPNKVTWSIKMSEMGTNGMNLTAKVQKSGSNKLLPLLIFVGFIILIIIIAVIAGGKKKGESIPVPESSSEE